MSEVIDSKVVELKFNNQEFEKNVQTSLSTLDKLKKSLTFDNVTKGVTALSSALGTINLRNISNQVSELTNLVDNSVSPITAAVNTIGSAITNTIGGAITGVVNQIETGGINRAFNIEAAKFSLQGLGIEWETVSDSINNAVSGTAYGLDQAAKAAAVLSASGIGTDVIGEDVLTGAPLKELERDLKAVSGIAAQTGQDFDRIADVFSTIANNGKVMTMQVRQFSTYGLNATADLAEYYGVATSDIDEMLQKGKISANDFFDMMYNKYWENAGKANETVTGVEANIKAALGRIGAAFISPIVENKGPLNQFLNAYMQGINTVAGQLKQLGATDEDGKLIQGKLTSYVDKNIIKYMSTVTKWLNDYTDPDKQKRGDGILRLWRSVYRFLKGFFKLIQSGINYLERIHAAFKTVFPKSFQTYLLRVAKIWTEFTNSIYRSSKDIATRGEVFNRFKDIFSGLAGIFKFVKRLLKSVVEGFKEFYDELPDQPLQMFTKAFENIGTLFKKFKPQASGFKNIFKGLWTVISNVATVYLAFITAVIETMQDLDIHPLEFIGKVFKTLFGGLDTDTKKLNRLKNTFKIFTTIIGVVAKILGGIILVGAKVINIILRIGNVITYILSPIGELISTIATIGTELGKKLVDKIKKLTEPFGGFKGSVDKARESIETFVDNVTSKINDFKKYISEGINSVDFSKFENLQIIADGIKNAFETAQEKIGNAIDWITDRFSSASDNISGDKSNKITTSLDGILGFFDKIAGAVLTVKDNIVDFLSPALDGIKTAFSDAFGSDTRKDIKKTNKKLEDTGNLDIFKSVGGIITRIGKMFKRIGSVLNLDDLFNNISDKLLKKMDLDEDADAYDVIIGSFNLVVGFVCDLISAVLEGLGKIGDTIKDNEGLKELSKEIRSWLGTINLSAIALAIFNFSSGVKDFGKYLQQSNEVFFYKKFTSILDSISTFIVSLSVAIIDIVTAIGLMVSVLSFAKQTNVDMNEVYKVIGIIGAVMLIATVLFAGLATDMPNNKTTGSMKGWFKELKVEKLESTADQITKMIMAIAGAMIAMTAAFGIMVGVLAYAQKEKVDIKQVESIMGMFAGFIVLMALLVAIPNIISQYMSGAETESSTIKGLSKTTKKYKGNNDATDSSKAMKHAAKTIIAAAAGIYIMAKAFEKILKVIKGQKVGTVETATNILAGMILSLIAIVALVSFGGSVLSKNQNDVNKFNTFALDGALVAFAGALWIMAEVFKTIINTISGQKKTEIALAAGIMTAMAAELAFIVWFISNKTKRTYSTNALLSEGILAIDMMALAGSLVIMAEAFKKILNAVKDAEWTQVLSASAIIAVMCIALGAIVGEIALLNQKPLDWTSIASEGVLAFDMLSFAWALKDMAKAFKIMINAVTTDTGNIVNEDAIKHAEKMFIAMMISLGAIVGEVSLLGWASSSPVGMAAQLISSLAADLTMWGFADNVKSLTKTFKTLIDDDNLTTLDTSKVEAISTTFSTIVQALSNMFNLDSITTLTTIIGAISGGLIGSGNAQMGIGVAVGAGIGLFIGELAEYLEGNALIDNIKKVVKIFKDFADDEDIKEIDNETLVARAEAFNLVLEGYSKLINADNQSIVEKIMKYVDDIFSFLQDFNSKDVSTEMTDAATGFKEFINAMPEGLTAGDITRYAEAFSAILEAYATFADSIKDYVNADFDNMENWDTLVSNITTLMQSFKDSTMDLITISVDEYEDIEKANAINRAQAITNAYGSSKAKDEMDKAAAAGVDVYYGSLESAFDDMDPNTKKSMDDAAQAGVDATIDAIEDNFGSTLSTDAIMNRLKKIGEQITAGVASGMTDSNAEDKIKNASLKVIDWTETSMEKKAIIKSPSRLFKKKIGYNIMDGIIAGITGKMSSLQDSASSVIDTLESSLSGAKDKASDLMNFNVGDLTLTPVVDMSNVEDATGQINDLFSNQSMSFNSDISGIQSSMQQIQNQDPNADLMSAINGLKDNINNNYTSYNVNGITYDDGSNIASAVQDLITATNIQGRM